MCVCVYVVGALCPPARALQILVYVLGFQFRVWGLGFRGLGLGFGVWGFGFWVWG